MYFKKTLVVLSVLFILMISLSCNKEGQNMPEEKEPETAKEWILKGFEYNQEGEPEKAIECFDKAIEMEPDKLSGYSCRIVRKKERL